MNSASCSEILTKSLQHDLDKKQADEDKKAEERNRLMLAQIQNIKEQKKREPTRRPSARIRKKREKQTWGQRLSNGDYVFLCTYCHKTWDQTTIPPHLQIPMEFVGG